MHNFILAKSGFKIKSFVNFLLFKVKNIKYDYYFSGFASFR